MNDTMGHAYDVDAAGRFAHEHTGVAANIVAEVLRTKNRYLMGMGIAEAEGAHAAQEAQAVRASAPELFPPKNIHARYVDIGLERAFIMLETGASEEIVRAVVRADDAYMRTLGLIVQVG